METRVVEMVLLKKGERLFHDSAISIRIDDEAAGEFLILSQSGDKESEFRLNKNEWPQLKSLIDDMFERHVREYDD